VDLFVLSGRLWVGAAKGMSEVRRAKRFELKSGKLKTSALITIQRYHEYYGGKAMNQRAAAILKIAMPNFKGFFLGDFISERMRFLTTFGSSSFSEYRMPSFAPVYSCIR
jgi:hypothetical protein